MSRIPALDYDKLTEDQRCVHDAIAPERVGFVEGPFRVWLQSTELADRAQALGAFCRHGTGLAPRLSELAILVTAATWRAGYEWHVHAPIGIKAGLAVEAAEAIRTGKPVHFSKPDEAAVYAFAKELLDTHRVSDATYERAVGVLGTKGVVELVGILGYYGLISMTINAFNVSVPDGAREPFPSP